MRNLFRLPLIFLFIGSCMGLLLRWHLVSPLVWLNYKNWLHGHSHIMFLGWVINALSLFYLQYQDLWSRKRYRILVIIIQLLLVGMLTSFPLEGYGATSIILSTMHTICMVLLCIWLLKDWKSVPLQSVVNAKISLFLFLISSAGPFMLGALQANGLSYTKWYNFAIYYYLHFQYNGVFIFGVLSLFYRHLEDHHITFNRVLAKRSSIFLFASLFPGYFLSILFAEPGLVFNAIGFIGSLLQIVFIVGFIKSGSTSLRETFKNKSTLLLVRLSCLSFIIKAVLQLISALPSIALLANEVRPFVISYLHLVVIGVVTLFLLGWYIEKDFVNLEGFRNTFLATFIAGFAGSEVWMIVSGIPLLNVIHTPFILFLFSGMMALGLAMFLWRSSPRTS